MTDDSSALPAGPCPMCADKDKFLSWVSHELRTPMTGIMGYASLLRSLIHDEKQKKYLSVVIEQVEKLTGLMDDLLDIQRFEEGRVALDLREMDLNALVKETLSLHRGTFADKRITLMEDLPDRLVKIRGDSERLGRAIANLLSNAAKFTLEEGLVTVTLETSQSKAMLLIRDNGPGIPAEAAQNLFSRFQATTWQTRQKNQGVGLGLPLAHQIVSCHRGRIGVSSTPGMGSEFLIEIPLATVE